MESSKTSNPATTPQTALPLPTADSEEDLPEYPRKYNVQPYLNQKIYIPDSSKNNEIYKEIYTFYQKTLHLRPSFNFRNKHQDHPEKRQIKRLILIKNTMEYELKTRNPPSEIRTRVMRQAFEREFKDKSNHLLNLQLSQSEKMDRATGVLAKDQSYDKIEDKVDRIHKALKTGNDSRSRSLNDFYSYDFNRENKQALLNCGYGFEDSTRPTDFEAERRIVGIAKLESFPNQDLYPVEDARRLNNISKVITFGLIPLGLAGVGGVYATLVRLQKKNLRPPNHPVNLLVSLVGGFLLISSCNIIGKVQLYHYGGYFQYYIDKKWLYGVLDFCDFELEKYHREMFPEEYERVEGSDVAIGAINGGFGAGVGVEPEKALDGEA